MLTTQSESGEATTLEILSPEPTRAVERSTIAPRLGSLSGLKVGLLDNNKPGATPILKRLGVALTEHGASECLYWRKALPSGPSPYVKAAAREADVVISGVGD